MRSYSDLYEIMEIRASGKHQALTTWVDRSLTLRLKVTDSAPNVASEKNSSRKFGSVVSSDIDARYSILSLNYDLVLERISRYISELYPSADELKFEKDAYDRTWESCRLTKLHGCASESKIVPPTWAKGTHPEIVPVWSNALSILEDANNIRFIGYSLPVADSYIKYLLKASIANSKHLKSIDVVCLDWDGTVRSRFEDFVDFKGLRFKNAGVLDYFDGIRDATRNKVVTNHSNPIEFNFDKLEASHESFMSV